MKKLLFAVVTTLLALSPLTGLAQGTLGYHRYNQVLRKNPTTVEAEIVPYAKVTVTNSVTGTAATIYSDPALSIQIIPSVVTADGGGNYSYYLPANYCVNESVSSVSQGSFSYKNICINSGAGSLSLTTTGTTGASTFIGSVLNVPVYQGQISLTTVGSSGPSTLIGNTLNIPDYSNGGGGCTPISSGGHCVTDNPTVNQNIVQPSNTNFSASNGGSESLNTFLGIDVQNDPQNLVGANHRGVYIASGPNVSAYFGAPNGASPVSLNEIQMFAGVNLDAYFGLGLSLAANPTNEYTEITDDSVLISSSALQFQGCQGTACQPGLQSGPMYFTDASGGNIVQTLPAAAPVWGPTSSFSPASTQLFLFKEDGTANTITYNVAVGDSIVCPSGVAACTSSAYTLSNQWDGVWLSSNGNHTWVVSQAYPLASGGGGGCSTGGIPTSSGSVTGDSTSTNCGANNRMTDTAAVPASDSTFGFTNLNVNSATKTVAAGTLNGAYTFGTQAVLLGDSNAIGASGTGNLCQLNSTYILGAANMGNGQTSTSCEGVDLNQQVIIGNNNLVGVAHPGTTMFENVIIGSYNLNSDMIGQALQLQELDNSQIIGNTAARAIAGSDITCIGDSACDNHAANAINNVFTIVAIGQTAASGIPNGESSGIFIGANAGGGSILENGAYGSGSFQTGIGQNAASGSTGTNTIAIGNGAIYAMWAGITVNSHNTGTNIIGIGTGAGRAQTTGSENIYIGTNAGCVGCSGITVANGNQTGSNNINIGNGAGPNVATQLSNTIAIGQNANTNLSNQTVIGNNLITSLKIFGSGDGCLSSTGGVITGSGSACGATSMAFSAITSATNTTAAMHVGSGASLDYSGTGVLNANQILGNAVPANGIGFLYNNGSGALSWTIGGGTVVKTTSYTALTTDGGMFTMNCASACALTLPAASIPAGYNLAVQAVNSGAVTVSPNGNTIYLANNTGGTGSITIPQGQTLYIGWDGTAFRASAPLLAGSNMTITPSSTGVTFASTVTSGLSGMTAGQVAIAGSATTITSSKALLGTDTSVVTGTGTFTASTIAIGDANGGVTTATALPNGITATTQAGASNDTKVATDAYVDAHFIANGTSAMGTGAITSGTCATVVTTAATGTATTDTIIYTPNADPTGVTGYAVSATGSLYIWAYPTANNVNFKVCNNTSGSLTPGALTLNWKVVR